MAMFHVEQERVWALPCTPLYLCLCGLTLMIIVDSDDGHQYVTSHDVWKAFLKHVFRIDGWRWSDTVCIDGVRDRDDEAGPGAWSGS